MGKWPQRHIIEIIDHAVTIWANQSHIPDDIFQALFQRVAIWTGFFKTGRITHHAASPHFFEFFQRVHSRRGRDGQKNCIRCFRQVVNAVKARQTAHLITPGVYGPIIPFKPPSAGFANRNYGVSAANKGDMTRV